MARGLGPGEVREVGVGGDAEYFGVQGLELVEVLREGDQLGGAHVGKIEGVEEQD